MSSLSLGNAKFLFFCLALRKTKPNFRGQGKLARPSSEEVTTTGPLIPVFLIEVSQLQILVALLTVDKLNEIT